MQILLVTAALFEEDKALLEQSCLTFLNMSSQYSLLRKSTLGLGTSIGRLNFNLGVWGMMTSEQLTHTKLILTDPFFGDAVRFIHSRINYGTTPLILDAGCGTGRMSVFFALHGAIVIGIDKNEDAIKSARSLSRTMGVAEKCNFVVSDSLYLPFENQTFDLIFSRSTLQYMNREVTLTNYHNILKNNARLAIIENLPYNPLINIYRLIRRIFATSHESKLYIQSIKGYITYSEISTLSNKYSFPEVQYYHLLRMISIFFLTSGFSGKLPLLLDKILEQTDNLLLAPPFSAKHLAWYVAFTGVKTSKEEGK